MVSEANILKHVQILEDIGYRIVGTEEAEAGELYVYDEVEALANQCALSEVLECNVWYQKGDGMHQSVILGQNDWLKMTETVDYGFLGLTSWITPYSSHIGA